MTRILQLNVAVYELLLPVFPPDLRGEFGESMIRTFEEQIDSASKGGSAAGVVSVWMDVMRDFVRIALPYRATAAAVPILTLLGSSVIFSLMLWGIAPHGHCGK